MTFYEGVNVKGSSVTHTYIDRLTTGIKGCFMNIGFDKLAEYFSQVKPLVKHQQPLPASLINATQE